MSTPLELTIAIGGHSFALTGEACRTLEHLLIQVARATIQGDDIQVKTFEPVTGKRENYTFKGGETVRRLGGPTR